MLATTFPHFDLAFCWSLLSLFLIVVYAILVFRNVDPLVATAIGVVLGFIFNKSNPIAIGITLQGALSSFLALIGFIIMLGRGLGEVLSATKVSHTLVYKIVYGIGINSQRRFKIGVIASSVIIVGVLGTLAGGLAILAPLLRPIAAKVGINKPSLAVLMQASGEEALILGPFAPPVIALLGVTGLSYPHVLLTIALPISCVTLVTTWVMAKRLQLTYAEELFVIDAAGEDNDFTPTKEYLRTTTVFLLGFITCVIYGLANHANTSYVIFVMFILALLTGISGKLSLTKIFELLLSGMSKNLNLFVIFLLLDPFLNLIQSAGGFHALAQLFLPLEHWGGKASIAILTGLTGSFGMPAAAAAVIKMLYELFAPIAIQMKLSMTTFAFSILLATRITNFAYPGANMFAAMGLAESSNIKAMIKNGLSVTLVQTVFLIAYSLAFS
jgi:TRAP-type transport system large permease protein